MVQRRKPPAGEVINQPPARTIEAREQQLVNLATSLAERQMAEGTASSQVITHYLKLGSTMAQKEREKIQYEIELLKARKVSLERQDRIEELFDEAIKAMSRYQGRQEEEYLGEVYEE